MTKNQVHGIYFERPSDASIRDEYLAEFRDKTLEELVELHNRQAGVGITGVHRQMIYLRALWDTLSRRTGQRVGSGPGPVIPPMKPVKLVDGLLIPLEDEEK